MKKSFYLYMILAFAVVLFSLFSNCSYTEPQQPEREADLVLSFSSIPGENLTVAEGGTVTLQWKAVGGIGDVSYAYWVIDITTAASPDTLTEVLSGVTTSLQIIPEDGHTYSVVVTATDDEDDEDTIQTDFVVTVLPSQTTPSVEILSPVEGYMYATNSDILFEWGGSDPNGEAVEFSYKLSSGDWSDYEQRRNIGMSDLAAGSYTFYVKVKNSDGVETSTSVDFEVKEPNILVFCEISAYGTGDDYSEFTVAQVYAFENFYKMLFDGFAVKWHQYQYDGELTDADFAGIDIFIWLGSNYHDSYGWNVGYEHDYWIARYPHYGSVWDNSWAGDLVQLKAVSDFLDGGGKIIWNDQFPLSEYTAYNAVQSATVIDSSVTPVTTTTYESWWTLYFGLVSNNRRHYVIPADTAGSVYRLDDTNPGGSYSSHAVKNATSIYPTIYPTLTADAAKPGVSSFQVPACNYASPASIGLGGEMYTQAYGSPSVNYPSHIAGLSIPDISSGSELERVMLFFPFYQFDNEGARSLLVKLLELMGESW